ncbi:MAG: hypothetical protein V1821_01315 [bacterium]
MFKIFKLSLLVVVLLGAGCGIPKTQETAVPGASYDPRSIPIDKEFVILDVQDPVPNFDTVTYPFAVTAYPCYDSEIIYDDPETPENEAQVKYFRNDFFLAPEGKASGLIWLGESSASGAGSGECSLGFERMREGLDIPPGKYELFVVRKKEAIPDKRSASKWIKIKN